MKRMISLLLCLCMMFALLPAAAMAGDGTAAKIHIYETQDGTEPIETLENNDPPQQAYGWVELRDLQSGGFGDGIDSDGPGSRFRSAGEAVTAEANDDPAMMQFVWCCDGVYTILQPTEVTAAGDGIVAQRKPTEDDAYADGTVYTLTGTSDAEGEITVAGSHGGKAYSFQVPYEVHGSRLPDYGIYSEPTVSEKNLLEVFDISARDEVWLLPCGEGVAISDRPMIVDNDEQEIEDTPFEMVWDSDVEAWKLRLKAGQSFAGEERLAIIFNLDKADDGSIRDFERVRISVVNESLQLRLARLSGHQSGWTYDKEDLSNRIRMEKGQSDTYVLLVGDKPCMSTDELRWDEDMLRLRPMGGFLGGYDIDALKWGEVIITHKSTGMTARVNIEPGYLELYSEPEADTKYYLSEAVLTDTAASSLTVYAMFREPEEVQGEVTCGITVDQSVAEAKVTPLYNTQGDRLLGVEIELYDIVDSGELMLYVTNGEDTVEYYFNLTMRISGADDTVDIPEVVGDKAGDSEDPALFSVYRTVDKENKPQGKALCQLGLGNREADHTFYVFGPRGGLFQDGTELTAAMGKDYPVYIREIDTGSGVYFRVQILPRRDGRNAFRFLLDGKEIRIKAADPRSVIGTESEWVHEGLTSAYYLGLTNMHSDSLSEQGEEASFLGKFYQDMPPYAPPTIRSRPIVGVMGIDPVSQQPQLYYDAEHSTQIKVLSTGLYDFRDGEFVNVDSDNDHFEETTLNPISNVTSCKAKTEVDSDGTYYVVTTVELYGERYTYCFSIFLDYYTIGDVNLEDPSVLAQYDGDKNRKIDMEELNGLIEEVTDNAGDDVTRVRVTLPKDNPLEGVLRITCTKTLLLLGNNNTLIGSVRAEASADNDWHEIYDLHCVSPTYNEGIRSGVGFSGHGEVFPRDCSFTGYRIGLLWAADDWENQTGPNGVFSRREMSTAILDCDIGFLYDPQSCEGGLGNGYSGLTFFRNGVAFQVESQRDIRTAGDILRIEDCVFVDNGYDMFNKSEYVVKMPYNYFGTYTGSNKNADARNILRALDPEEELEPAVLKGVNQGQGNGWIFGAPQALRADRRGDYWYQLRVDTDSCCLFGEEGTVFSIDNADAQRSIEVMEGYEGVLDVQQFIESEDENEKARYENIATWDFSKEDEAQ